MQRIRMVDLAARHAAVAPKVEAGVLQVLRSGAWIGGPWVQRAEQALAESLGHHFGVGVASGTDALMLSLQALGIGPGDRVALPALSFFATTEAVLQLGATPVFVDVLPERPVMDPELLPEDVRAVVLVHLFGQRCPTPHTKAPILSDAAQCLGWGHGRPEGLLSALSLYPSKTLGAAGDGGLVLTDDESLAQRVRALGNHGMGAPHEHLTLGRNSRLDAVQAAVVLGHLPALPSRVAARRRWAAALEQALQGHPTLRPLPRAPEDGVHQLILRCTEGTREATRLALDSAGVDCAVYYPRPMDTQPLLTGQAQAPSRCPQAARFCEEALALPCHEGLSERDFARILGALGVRP